MKNVLQKVVRFELPRLGFFLAITIGTALIFMLTPSLFPSALLAVVLFFTFCPLIDALERKGFSRVLSIFTLFFALGSILSAAAIFVVPKAIQEMKSFEKNSQEFTANIEIKLRAREQEWTKEYPSLTPVFQGFSPTQKIITAIEKLIDHMWINIPQLLSHAMIVLFLCPLITFILLKDSKTMRRKLMRLVPNRYFETFYSLISRILDKMGGYVAARILEAFLVMMMVTVGCLIAKIPFAVMFGFFAGATNPIPYLGPLIGALPAISLALIEPTIPHQLSMVLMIFMITNLVDTILIFPLVVARVVDMPALVVVISVFLGSQFFGILGMLLSVPLTAIFLILLSELYGRLYSNVETLE